VSRRAVPCGVPTRRLTARTLLALPLLVGGLLLMHGLEASVGGGHPGHGGQLVASGHETDSHDDVAGSHEGAHCVDCWADVLTACLGVLVGLVTLGLVRGWAGPATSSVALLAATCRSRERWELWHPPEPAWLRLAVMRR
jgi:hypothetical protein